jgi:hypothetical protein
MHPFTLVDSNVEFAASVRYKTLKKMNMVTRLNSIKTEINIQANQLETLNYRINGGLTEIML